MRPNSQKSRILFFLRERPPGSPLSWDGVVKGERCNRGEEKGKEKEKQLREGEGRVRREALHKQRFITTQVLSDSDKGVRGFG